MMLTQFLVYLAVFRLSHCLTINVASSGGNKTSGKQYGIMFEDINHSGDGGIYAELIQNRAFQGNPVFPSSLDPWFAVGGAQLSLKNLSDPLSSALPTSMNVAVGGSKSGAVGFGNPGFWGIDVKNQKYTGSFYVKGDYSGYFTASLTSNLTSASYGSVKIRSRATSKRWVEHKYTLSPKDAPNSNNTLVVTFDAKGVKGGSLDFNLISLFPPTYKNRPNGMRVDLMEKLAKLKPSFLRLPGGNNLEGNDPPYYWKWNETIGPLTQRPGRPGTWGYQNTDGLGLVEYMNWCTDLNMEPILAVWAGYYLDGPAISNSSLGPYVQSTLDELEFLMGDTSTKYGALRASLGYPEPWKIKYIEVGNEDNLGSGGSSYESYRFNDFYYAIHAKYPDILIFPSTVDYMKTLPGKGTGDYHQYTRPDYFISQFSFFDQYPADRVAFVGEYAAVQPNVPAGGGVDWNLPRWSFPTWVGTVSEAVFLLGMERNADRIMGSSYAPLLQNLNSYQWTPDLISYSADPKQDVESTSYKLVELYSGTRITDTLPAPASDGSFGPVYWVAGINSQTGSYILKAAIYNSTSEQSIAVNFKGLPKGAKGTLKVLTAPSAFSYNDVGLDTVNTRTTEVTAGANGAVEIKLPNYSIAVLELHNSGGYGSGYGYRRSFNSRT